MKYVCLVGMMTVVESDAWDEVGRWNRTEELVCVSFRCMKKIGEMCLLDRSFGSGLLEAGSDVAIEYLDRAAYNSVFRDVQRQIAVGFFSSVSLEADEPLEGCFAGHGDIV